MGDNKINSRKAKTASAWIILIAWVAFIYLTLGTVPKWREFLVTRYGEGVFAVITFAIGGVAVAFILGFMIIRNREKRLLPYIALITIVLFLRYVMRHWITIPVEQIHFIEYGLVGFLSFNALRRHLRGWGLITAAIFLTYLFGMVDECIQGLLANRVGEQRDMYWNGLAGLLALGIITLSIRPAIVAGRSGRREWRAHIIMLALSLPIQGYFNSAIAQFGVLIQDDSIGAVFRSRLEPEALQSYDDNLDHFKTEIAPLIGKERMVPLVERVYNRIHEEALVHSFRRFAHYRYGNFPVAYKENLIIEKYFYQFVEGTDLDWPPAMSKDLQDKIGDLAFSRYHSPVAEHLITKFTETQMWVVIILLEGVVITLLALSWRRRDA